MKLAHILPLTPYPYTGTTLACPLCGDASSTIVATRDRRLKELTSVCCDGCGLVRTDPMPTEAELNAYYSGEYRNDYQLASERPSRRHIGVSAREAGERLKRLSRALSPGCAVMDFGAGSGEFVKAASDAGYKAIGVEPGDAFSRFARTAYGVEIDSRPLDALEFPDASFDVITSHHVIEHLRDPIAALRKFKTWLRPGGVIYIAVPDITNSRKPTFDRFHFAHIYNFSPETLAMAARRVGLEPHPDFEQEGTVVVLRHAAHAATAWRPDRTVAARVRAALPHVSVRAHILSGAWVIPMVKRALKYRKQVKAANDIAV